MHRRIFFTADLHLGHGNIIGYCTRPFKSVEEMNEEMLKNWNSVIKVHDIVYVLGDIGFEKHQEQKEFFHKANGTKVLVLGNHDKFGQVSYYNMGFSAVLQEAVIKLGKQTITLGHKPRRTLIEFLRLMKVYWLDPHKRAKSIKHKWARLMREWRSLKTPSNSWHLCGHVHEAWKIRGKNINVGVDVNKFTPIGSDSILKIIEEAKK